MFMSMFMSRSRTLTGVLGAVGVAVLALMSLGQSSPLGFGDPLPNATSAELARFLAGKDKFEETEGISDGGVSSENQD